MSNLVVGAASWVAGYIQSSFWNIAAERQVKKMRIAFFQNLLRQDVGWYDLQESGSTTAKFSEEIVLVRKGLGDKVPFFIQHFGAFIGGMVIGFYKAWKLAFVALSLSPLMIASLAFMVKVAFTHAQQESEAYSKAGVIAQEVISAIRTVASFGGQEREVQRYAANLDDARKEGTKKGFFSGIAMGVTYFLIFAAYAVAFSYGVQLINEKEPGYTIGVVTTAFFAIIMGTFSIGMGAGGMQAVASARSSAYSVFEIIDRIPPIDTYSKRGKKYKNDTFKGRIELKNVSFRYPSRPDVDISKDISLTIEPGTTVALVGPSGCGKSTIIQLLQRFYDPESGQVLVDGDDLRDLNIFWFRSLIGSVSQEPVLFGTTIYENIRFGYPCVGEEVIIEAAKKANAHNFIMKLPQGYQTMVGEQGTQMSGGQKQRIAIARALVRNPRILLLDEATSALDTESEAIVQDALDKAREGRTTIAIAHRLSTIMNADKIIVLDQGVVQEEGTHKELIRRNGVYAKLVEAQQGGREVGEIDAEHAKERRTALANRRKAKQEAAGGQPSFKQQEQNDKAIEGEKKKSDKEMMQSHFSALRLWKMAKSELPFFSLGLLGALVAGAVWPCFAIVFAKLLNAFSSEDESERTRLARVYALSFFGVGFAIFLAYLVMMTFLAIAGEKLVVKVRIMAFRAMLHQEIGWFDDENNSVGVLTNRLATQAGAVRDATGASLAQSAQAISALIAALTIGFIHEWRITLIMIAFLPLIIMGNIVQAKVVGDFTVFDKYVEEAAKALVQSTTNIRTVTALGIHSIFIDMFNKPLFTRHRSEMIKLQIGAIFFGFTEGAMLFAYAAAFYAGARFMEQDETEFENMFTALAAVMFSSFSLGQANALAPDQKKAKVAVAEIFKLLDRIPKIKWHTNVGNVPENFEANADFSDVQFYYPSRPSARILKGLSLNVDKGKTVALVGQSGGGKSTVIQLLERFYDPTEGQVNLDGHSLKDLNLNWSRGKMSLVSQEPVLFDRTIAENIVYGCEGLTAENMAEMTTKRMEDIEKAAREANIHDFIDGLPEKYKTRVGERGGQLSGGQKQRVAIARALIRQPKMLLLDEATSALDSESEKIVQDALDNARCGRTVVVIAHRLSTIENSDLIFVIENGLVGEFGKHEELLAKKGTYYDLWSAQQLSC